MSEDRAPQDPGGEENRGSPAFRRWIEDAAGALLFPLIAILISFLIGAIIMLATGNNPVTAFGALFRGAFGDATALGRTLLNATPLIFTGLAVAVAFRAGLFNIGGEGQFFIGAITAAWLGVSLGSLGPLGMILALLGCILTGFLWGAIPGFLKAYFGAHEVITTIMLNWIAVFGGAYLFEIGGPLQGGQPSIPRSHDVFESARLWPIWGSLPALHAGIFIALFALVVYYVVLNRTTLGFEVRAVGFNAEAARYGGISVRKNYFLALAISGAFAGLAGSVDLLGFKFGVDVGDFATNLIAFTGIAVALLGRNKAIGILFAALLFAALEVGTSTRQLDPTVFEPALAVDLATMIQALVIFFVGAELLILYAWRVRRFVTRQPRIAPELERP